MPRPPTIVFVGSFRREARDGTVGGAIFACRSLLDSPLSEQVRWRLIDSTLLSWPPPPPWRRALAAGGRIARFALQLLDPRVRGALIFVAGGSSLAEKGVMVLLATACGKPAIITPRSGHLVDDLARSAQLRRFARLVFASAARVMCQGEVWARYYRALGALPQERFVVVPNWIDTRPYTALPRPTAAATGAPVRVLFLSRLERAKGVLDLVEAVARLGERERSASQIVIGGEGPDRGAVEQALAQRGVAGCCELAGWLKGPDKLQALAAADIYVFPSHVEGFPNALLEAMAAGLPVVATDVGAVRELVTDGENGLIVPPQQPEALAVALARLIGDAALRQRLGAAARAHVVRQHDVAAGWRRVHAVLEAALAERVGPRRTWRGLRAAAPAGVEP